MMDLPKKRAEKFVLKTQRLGHALKRRMDNDRPGVRRLIDVLLLPSDIVKIRRGYKAGHGTYPHIWKPQTFNEYLQHAKIFRRRRIMIQLSDKIAVRDYVKAHIGEEYLTRVYWTGDDLEQVNWSALPQAFVIKSNNGSGTNIIVNDKEAFDWREALKKTRAWMTSNQSVHFAEWQYRWIEPQLLIEEFLDVGDGSPPPDFKFFCFNGKLVFRLIVQDRFGNITKDFVDKSCRALELSYPSFPSAEKIDRPDAWAEMVRLSEKLSAGLEFSRIDFYSAPKVIFGEITLTPEAGNTPFLPEKYDRLIYESFLSSHRSNASDKDKLPILHPREDA